MVLSIEGLFTFSTNCARLILVLIYPLPSPKEKSRKLLIYIG